MSFEKIPLNDVLYPSVAAARMSGVYRYAPVPPPLGPIPVPRPYGSEMREDDSVLACLSNPKQAACMRSLIAIAQYINCDLGGISEEHAKILLGRARFLASMIAEEASQEKVEETVKTSPSIRKSPRRAKEVRDSMLEDMEKSSRRAQGILRWCTCRISARAIEQDWRPELKELAPWISGPEDKKRMPEPRRRNPAVESAPPRPRRIR